MQDCENGPSNYCDLNNNNNNYNNNNNNNNNNKFIHPGKRSGSHSTKVDRVVLIGDQHATMNKILTRKTGFTNNYRNITK